MPLLNCNGNVTMYNVMQCTVKRQYSSQWRIASLTVHASFYMRCLGQTHPLCYMTRRTQRQAIRLLIFARAHLTQSHPRWFPLNASSRPFWPYYHLEGSPLNSFKRSIFLANGAHHCFVNPCLENEPIFITTFAFQVLATSEFLCRQPKARRSGIPLPTILFPAL
jgi:hypothetical protein